MILRGEPIDIHFLGFRSTTYDLQRAGWEIAEEHHPDILRDEWRIAIRHPVIRMSGMSRPIDRYQLFSRRQRMYGGPSMGHPGPITLQIDIAIQYMVQSFEANRHMNFFPVDATPVYEGTMAECDLYDMPYFRPIDEGKEIFLRKASVDEIMQIALDKQEPEQARIRAARQAEQKREDYRRGGKTEAKLILVA